MFFHFSYCAILFAAKMTPKIPAAYLMAKQKGKAMDKCSSKAIVPKDVVVDQRNEIVKGKK